MAKVEQTSGKKTCFQFPECSLPYAKVIEKCEKHTVREVKFPTLHYFMWSVECCIIVLVV